jgi:hypothetical protein
VRGLVALAGLAELLLPDHLGEPEDGGGELAAALLLGGLGAFFGPPVGPGLSAARGVAEELIEFLRVDAQQSGDQQEDHPPDTAADGQRPPAHAAAVFEVLALFALFPIHVP